VTTVQPAVGPPGEEAGLIQALRSGEESAFTVLLARYHTALVRLAMVYVHDRAVAEEVAQETWLGVLQGLGRFEARSSLKTWIFHILVNRAKTRAARRPQHSLLCVVGPGHRARRGSGAARAVPSGRSPAMAASLGGAAAKLGQVARRAPCRAGDPGPDPRGGRYAPTEPAGGHHPARH
jgi:hypothetical protein